MSPRHFKWTRYARSTLLILNSLSLLRQRRRNTLIRRLLQIMVTLRRLHYIHAVVVAARVVREVEWVVAEYLRVDSFWRLLVLKSGIGILVFKAFSHILSRFLVGVHGRPCGYFICPENPYQLLLGCLTSRGSYLKASENLLLRDSFETVLMEFLGIWTRYLIFLVTVSCLQRPTHPSTIDGARKHCSRPIDISWRLSTF